jgi:hypothetical protein
LRVKQTSSAYQSITGFDPNCDKPFRLSNDFQMKGVLPGYGPAICSLLVLVENDHRVSAGDRVKWNEVVPAPISPDRIRSCAQA